jgi:hypothetical protein
VGCGWSAASISGSQTRCHGEGSRAAIVGEMGVEDEPYYRRWGASARPVGAGVFKCESENNIGVNPSEFDRFQNILLFIHLLPLILLLIIMNFEN